MNFVYPSNFLIAALNLCLLGLCLMACSCAQTPYQTKPLNPAQTSAQLSNKDATSADFNAYLIKQGYKEADLPFAEWDLNDLTLCALYYHSKLDVAKAQLALANTAVNSAGTQQSPTLGGRLAHSNQANNDKSPWTIGLDVEIPVETTNKRQIKVEEAQHLLAAARLYVAEVAWQLRSQIANDLLRYYENSVLQKQLTNALNQQNNLIKLLTKRMQLGAASNTELNAAKLLQQKAQFSLNAEQKKSAEILAVLAADVGLTNEKFALLHLKPLDIEAALSTVPDMEHLQQKALLNRVDIRRSLSKYAAAESKIKLEIAKQTPDISLNPGFAFEFGDSIWSLGFSSLFSLLNKNQTLVAEATKLREIEGAQFEALQAEVIAAVSQAQAGYQASLQNVLQAKQQLANQRQYSQKLQNQFDAGLIDRLALTQNNMNTQALEQQLVTAQFQQLNAMLALENSVQMPLNADNILNDKTIQIQ